MAIKKKTEFDNMAETYCSETINDLGKWGKYRHTAFLYKVQYLKYILSETPKGICDFGCGIGLNIPYLKQYFPTTNLYGCDVSANSVEMAAGHYPYCHFQTIRTVEDLEIYKNKVDVVFISTVMHHIPTAEHQQWLQKLYEILNRGGLMVIFEHNNRNPFTKKTVQKSPIDKDATMLHFDYCKQMVARIFFDTTVADKEVRIVRKNIKLRYTYFFPWRNKFFTAIERLLLYRIPLGAQYCVYAKK